MDEPKRFGVGDRVRFICGMPGPDMADGIVESVDGDWAEVRDTTQGITMRLHMSAFKEYRNGGWWYVDV